MMICTNCGANISAGQRFCASCGSPVPAAPTGGQQCAACGATVAPGLAFCTNCGTPLGAAPYSVSRGPACVSCGAPVAPGLAFCTNCGAPVQAGVAPAYAYAPAPPARKGGGGATVAIVGVFVLLLVALGGGAWWYMQNQKPSQTVAAAVSPVPGQTQVAAAQPAGGLTLPGGLSLPVIGATPVPSPTPTPPPRKAEVKDVDESTVVQSGTWGPVPANQVNIMLKEGQTRQDAERMAKELGGTIVGEIERINMYQIQTQGKTEADLETALAAARKLNNVDAILPNQPMFLKAIPCQACGDINTGPYQGDAGRAYQVIGVDRAWKLIKASGVTLSDVNVGVSDSAFNSSSGEIKGQTQIEGLTPKDITNQAKLTHGTAVTHVLGADANNGGVAGVAGILGAKLKMKVSGKDGSLLGSAPDPAGSPLPVYTFTNDYVNNVIASFENQIKAKSTIINCSFGTDKPMALNAPAAQLFRAYFEKVAKENPDVLFVIAAGNENGGLDGTNYAPGGLKLPNVMTVGAVKTNGDRAGFSNYTTGDAEVTLSAPGEKIVVSNDDPAGPTRWNGTSFATPMVSGTAALLKSINPKLNAAEIKQLLVATARKDVQDPNSKETKMVPANMGAGVLRVDLAVLKAINDRLHAEGKPTLDEKRIEQLATIEGSADSKNPMEFTVKAKLQAVGSDGTSVKIELKEGKGAMVTGAPAQKLSAPGEVSWEIKLNDPKSAPIAHICRMDTDACCDVKLQVIDLAGEWKGTWTITEVDVPTDITIPDPLDDKKPPTVIKKEDCEKVLKESMNKANQIKMDFKPSSPEAGTVILTTVDDKGKESKSDPLQYKFDGAKVNIGGTKQGSTIMFDGNVTATEKEYKMEGPFSITMAGEKEAVGLKILGSFSVTKPAPEAAPAAAPKPAAKP